MNVREWALPVYTILMQLAVGAQLGLWIVRAAAIRQHGRSTIDHILRIPMLAVFLTIILAIIGSHFHLSQPIFSLLAALNLSQSWLSREIIFTISFLLLVGGILYVQWFTYGHPRLMTVLGWLGVLSGGLSVYSMSHIYLLPTHSSWNSPLTTISFLLSALILGVTAVAVLLVMDLKVSEVAGAAETAVRRQIVHQSFIWLAAVAGITAVVTLVVNIVLIFQLSHGELSALTSLYLMLGLYQPLFGLRYIALFTGVSWFGLTAYILLRRSKPKFEMTTPVYLACLLVLISEILGRFLFYATHVRTGI